MLKSHFRTISRILSQLQQNSSLSQIPGGQYNYSSFHFYCAHIREFNTLTSPFFARNARSSSSRRVQLISRQTIIINASLVISRLSQPSASDVVGGKCFCHSNAFFQCATLNFIHIYPAHRSFKIFAQRKDIHPIISSL